MEDNRWYYHDNGASVGPFSWSRLVDLFKATLIRNDTLVWQEGSEDWRLFQDVARESRVVPPPLPSDSAATGPKRSAVLLAENLESSLAEIIPRHASYVRPDAAEAAKTTTPSTLPREVIDGRTWTSHPVAPWRRYFARLLDTVLNGAVGSMILGVAFYAFKPETAERFFNMLAGPEGRFLDVLLTVLVALPINALMIGITSSTLGKIVFGVKVVDRNLKPVGVGRAFRRELHVWYAGLGFGIPIVALICEVFAFRRLTSTGVTSWDASQDLMVLHRPVGPLQHLLYLVGVAMIFGVLGIIGAME